MEEVIPVWMEGTPPELLARAETAQAACYAAAHLRHMYPDDPLTDAAVGAAICEAEDCRALLQEWRVG